MENELAPVGHPIHTLMQEHQILQNQASRLFSLAQSIASKADLLSARAEMEEVVRIVEVFKNSQSHYLREENVLFPLLEKAGFVGPPQAMWAEHEQIRAIEKNLFQLMDKANSLAFKDFASQFRNLAGQQAQMLQSHFFKENNILFPHGMELLSAADWEEVIREFGRIGYCPFTPEADRLGAPSQAAAGGAESDSSIKFLTGTLSKGALEAIFQTLPVELTFVDKADTFVFFSHLQGAIFTRSTATLGTRVQNCHPPKSLHLVNKILQEFKAGTRDVAEFWINFQGKIVHIRYFAVRDSKGQYLGSLEVSQDITEIQKIKGEKRLV